MQYNDYHGAKFSAGLLEKLMLVEVFNVDKVSNISGRGKMRVIAVQYHSWDNEMERRMRAANPLFDTVVEGMSPMMVQRMRDGHHRTAIFELAE